MTIGAWLIVSFNSEINIRFVHLTTGDPAPNQIAVNGRLSTNSQIQMIGYFITESVVKLPLMLGQKFEHLNPITVKNANILPRYAVA